MRQALHTIPARHRPVRSRYPSSRQATSGIDKQLQAQLLTPTWTRVAPLRTAVPCPTAALPSTRATFVLNATRPLLGPLLTPDAPNVATHKSSHPAFGASTAN